MTIINVGDILEVISDPARGYFYEEGVEMGDIMLVIDRFYSRKSSAEIVSVLIRDKYLKLRGSAVRRLMLQGRIVNRSYGDARY